VKCLRRKVSLDQIFSILLSSPLNLAEFLSEHHSQVNMKLDKTKMSSMSEVTAYISSLLQNNEDKGTFFLPFERLTNASHAFILLI
jgi:hypothetical protein